MIDKDALFDNQVEVIIFTSSLVKDNNNKTYMYHANVLHLM